MLNRELYWYPEDQVKKALTQHIIRPKDWDAYESMRQLNVRRKSLLTKKQLLYKQDIEAMIDSGEVKWKYKQADVGDTKRDIMKNALPIRGWDKSARKIEYKGATLTVAKEKRRTGSMVYIARLDQGIWPSDDDLYSLCDGTIPPEQHHFGGESYQLSANMKRMIIYTD